MTVTFKRLQAQNATTYRNLDVPLDNQGLVLLRAENRDSAGSNGSGKSNIWEMFCHLIYGTTGKGVNKKGMLNQFVGKDMLIDLDLEVDGVPYTFRETRKHSEHGTGFFVYENDEDITPKRSAGKSEPQRLMQEIIGLSLKEFQGVIYLYQKYNHVLRNGTRGEKQAYLSSLFGLDKYDLLYQEAKTRLKQVEKEMAEYSSYERDLEQCDLRLQKLPSIPEIEVLIHATEKRIEEQKSSRQALTEKVTKLQAERQQVQRKREAIKSLKDLNFDVINIDELTNRIASTDKSISKIRSKVQSTQIIVQGLQHRLSIEEQIPESPSVSQEEETEKVSSLKQEILQKQSLLAQLQQKVDLKKKLDALSVEREKEVSITELEEEINRYLQEVDISQTHLQECEYSFRFAYEAKESVESITGGTCPTCHRPLTGQDKEKIIEALEISKKEIIYRAAKEDLEKVQQSLSSYQQRKTSLEEIMKEEARVLESFVKLPEGDYDEVDQSIQLQQSSLQEAEATLQTWATINTLTAQLESLPTGDLPQQQKILEDAQEQESLQLKEQKILHSAAVWIKDANLDIDPDNFNEEYFQTTQEDLAKVIEEIDLLIEEKTKLTNQQNEQLSVEKTKQTAETMLERASSLRPRLVYLPKLVDSFGPKGLKTDRLRLIMEQIVSIIPHYYGPLFSGSGYDVSVGKDLDFELSVMHDDKRVILPGSGASGGEGKALDMASLFAVRTLRTATKSANLLIIDEPYGALDSEKRSILTEQFRQLKETGAVNTVVIIAHEAEVFQHSFDQVWTVIRENNESKLHI